MNKQTLPAFTGVFIPAHIWTNSQMCWLDKVIWAVINTMHDGDFMCRMTDQQLADYLSENEMAISASVLKLVHLGIVHTKQDENDQRLLWAVNVVVVEKDAPKEEQASMNDVRAVVEIYHECCKSMPRVEKLTPSRVTRIRNMISEGYTNEKFKFLFLRAESSDFISGRSGRWTGASIDWITSPINRAKVEEGIYDNKRGYVALTRQLPENLRG